MIESNASRRRPDFNRANFARSTMDRFPPPARTCVVLCLGQYAGPREEATCSGFPVRRAAKGKQGCGSNSVVECQLPKLDVAGSSPVSRSIFGCPDRRHR